MVVPCAGIIVFDKNRTILVRTPVGYYSFPKGKRNKGEHDTETAMREFMEETNITKNDIELLNISPLDEMNDNNNLAVRYFVAHLLKPIEKIIFDPEELKYVDWYDVNICLKLDKLKQTRKTILQEAYVKYKEIINNKQ